MESQTSKTEDKEKILKASREKNTLHRKQQ